MLAGKFSDVVHPVSFALWGSRVWEPATEIGAEPGLTQAPGTGHRAPGEDQGEAEVESPQLDEDNFVEVNEEDNLSDDGEKMNMLPHPTRRPPEPEDEEAKVD